MFSFRYRTHLHTKQSNMEIVAEVAIHLLHPYSTEKYFVACCLYIVTNAGWEAHVIGKADENLQLETTFTWTYVTKKRKQEENKRNEKDCEFWCCSEIHFTM